MKLSNGKLAEEILKKVDIDMDVRELVDLKIDPQRTPEEEEKEMTAKEIEELIENNVVGFLCEGYSLKVG